MIINKRFQNSKKNSGIPPVSNNSLDQDKARHLIRPGLGSNCLQWLSADDKSRQGVKL